MWVIFTYSSYKNSTKIDSYMLNRHLVRNQADSSVRQIVFIDSQIEKYQLLIAGVVPGIKTVVIERARDGIKQITSALNQFSTNKIHIVAHGSPGCLYLGNTTLSLDTIVQYQSDLQTWFSSSDIDRQSSLLIYGCSVAIGDAGSEFVAKLHQATTATVSASTTPIGNSAKGGDWVLDVCRGALPTPSLAFTPQALANYEGVLGTGSNGGYTYYDSLEGNKGQVSFTDISSTGTDIRQGDQEQQEWQENIPLPFNFRFYGNDFNSITVSDNGAAAFGNATSPISPGNAGLPRSKPEYSIFPYWDDLKNAKVYYQQDGDRFIIQWSQVEHADPTNNSGTINFQVVLHKNNNNIEFVYQDVDFENYTGVSDGASATIGINKDNSTAIEYSLNQSSLSNVSSIRFVTEPILVNSTITLNEGETVTLTKENFQATDIDNSSSPNNITFLISVPQKGSFQIGEQNVTQFTQADINAGKVQFIHDGSEDAPSFGVKLTDGFNETDVKSIDTTSGITFSNINDNPQLNLTSEVTFNENALNQAASKIYSTVDSSDIDSSQFNGGNLTVSYQSGGGEQDQLAVGNSNPISLNGNNVSFNGTVIGNISSTSNGENGNNLVVNFTSDNASREAVEAVVQSLTYQNTSDTPNPSRTISVIVNDGGSTNDPTSKDSNEVTTEIKVIAENDPPVNILPTTEVVINEDLPFALTEDSQIAIDDPDAGNNKVQVRLSATKGTLTLNGTTGLSFNGDNGIDGVDDAVLQFTGTIDDINNALAGMTFNPEKNFNDNLEGQASVEIQTDDLGNSGTGVNLVDTDTLNLKVSPVNDAPVNTVPASVTADEDREKVITGLSIQDIDVNEQGESDLRVTLAVTKGFLKLKDPSGITFAEGNDNTGNAAITFTGTLAQINTALAAGVTYQGSLNYNGSDTLTITTNDLGNTGSGGARETVDTVDITVNAVNDMPSNTVPDVPQVVNEDAQLVFSENNGNLIRVDDLDFNPEFNNQPFTNQVEVVVSVNNGTLSLASQAGLEVENDNSATVKLTGTTFDVRNALNGLTYQGNANYNGGDTLTITTNDLGNSGLGDALIGEDTVGIIVNAVNDEPENTVPDAQEVNEDTQLVFSADNGNQITVFDLDLDFNPKTNQQLFTNEVQVTLAVDRGTLNLGSVENLTEYTGNGSNSINLRGTVANIDAALNGLTYQGNDNYNGSDTLTITTDDLGNVGLGEALTDVDTVDITVNAVNDMPSNTVPDVLQQVNEDAQLVFSENNGNLIRVDDLDFDPEFNNQPFTNQVEVVVAVNNGTLSLASQAGLEVENDNSATVKLTGTTADVRNALNGLTYQGNANYNGGDTLTITTNDLGNSGLGDALIGKDTVDITVNAVNDMPTNTVPDVLQQVNEDAQLVFSENNGNLIRVDDLDFNPEFNNQPFTNQVEVVVAVNNGTLSLASQAGLEVENDNSATVKLTGTTFDVRNALNGLTYQGNANYNGGDTLTITTNDLGNSGSGDALIGKDTVDITVNAVNDAPVNSVPSLQQVDEDTQLIFNSQNNNSISVSDRDFNPDLNQQPFTDEVRVTASVNQGSLTLGSTENLLNFENDGSFEVTLRGKVANINAALNGLTYQGNANYNGSDTLTITTDDLGNTGIGEPLTVVNLVNLTVNPINDPPVNAVIPAEQQVDEDTQLIFSSQNNNSISISDIDVDEELNFEPVDRIQVTVSVANGRLTIDPIESLIIQDNDSGLVTLQGTVEDVNTALDGLTYQGNANFNGSDKLIIEINDLNNGAVAGELFSKGEVDITVNAVNDAPVNTVPDVLQVVDEDAQLVFNVNNDNLISVGDLDFNPELNQQPFTPEVEAIATVTQGTLTLGSTDSLNVENDGTSEVIIRGKVADINAALNGLTYQGNANYNGSDTLTITTNDLGNTGIGEALQDVDTIDITVNAVNDAPANSVPVAQQVDEDTDLVFSADNSNQISVSDVDFIPELNLQPFDPRVSVVASVTQGTLSLGMSDLAIQDRDEATTSVTLEGTVEEVNAVLDGLTYRGNTNYNGSDTLTITTNDLGNSGSGKALTDIDTVDITVNAVNDAPSNTVSAAQQVDEDTQLVFSENNGNLIRVDDLDFNPEFNLQPFTNQVEVVVAVNNGTLSLASQANLEVENDRTATVKLTGTTADVRNALNGLTYQGNANYNGSDTLTITTNDLGNNGLGEALIDVDTVDITVNPVNDAPVNSVPVAQQVDQFKELFFSSANQNLISLSDRDLDEGNGLAEITLAVENGTLNLATVEGLSFTAGDGVSDRAMTFRGSQDAINRALDGVFYQSDRDFFGDEVLTFTTNDLGNFGQIEQTDTDTVNITVIPDLDADGVNNPSEAKIAEELATKYNNAKLNSLSEKAADEGSIVALYGDKDESEPIIISIVDGIPLLTLSDVSTQNLAELTDNPVAVFDRNDLRSLSLQGLTSKLDLLNYKVKPNSELTEEQQQQALEKIQQQPPIAVEIKLPEDLEVNTILQRRDDGTLFDFRRKSNPQKNELEYEMLTGAVLEDRDLDGLPDWAVVYLQDGAWGDLDGVVNGEIENSIVAADLDLGPSEIEVRESEGGLSFNGNQNYIQFSLNSSFSPTASEIGFARVRFGEDGQITEVNGEAVESIESAKQAIIRLGKTLFSSLKNKQNPNFGTPTRTVTFEEGEQAVFFVVQGGTQDELLANGLNSRTVKFSVPSLNDGEAIFTASSEDGQTVNLTLDDLYAIAAKIQTPEEIQSKLAMLALDQGSSANVPAEVIDLTSAAFAEQQVELQFAIQREAAYNNSAYLYRVEDATGAIVDPLTGTFIDPTTDLSSEQKQRYLELATSDLLVPDTQFETGNFTTSEVSTIVEGGGYYAPLLVSNGNLDTVEGNLQRVVTPYLEVNLDGNDHIRSLGSGIYGFEDKVGGGDRDYNDMILSITQVEIMA